MFRKSLGVIFIIVVQMLLWSCIASAATVPLRPENFTAEYPVYNTSTDENRIQLNWTASDGADFYIIEVSTEENWSNQTISEEVTTTATTYTDIRLNSEASPTSGTVFIYHLYAATYERDVEGNPTANYQQSTNYSSVTVLTDPSVSATALSTSEVKLIWDDIQYGGNSIDYEIIKKKRDVNVGIEQVKASEIGQSAIRVNGKLEYTIRNLDKSTEYTFLIYPLLSSGTVKFNPYVTVAGATNLSALIQRYNESIVKLLWDEYQGSVPATELYYRVIEITEVSGQKTYNTIATPEVPYYYIQVDDDQERAYLIEVRLKEDDSKIAESGEVSLEDMIVPITPPVSQLEDTVEDDQISLLWDTHKNIDGSRDTEIKYDVWLVTNPDDVDDIRTYYASEDSGVTDRRIGKDLEIVNGEGSQEEFSLVEVQDEDKYQYIISNLLPNTVYYVAVIAKKTFIMQDLEDPDLIISSTYTSEPTIETIRTTSGNLEQPVSLVTPWGVSLKNDDDGNPLVTTTSISIKWPLGKTEDDVYKTFYEDDVYFKVGYEIYVDDFDKSVINDPNNPDYNIQTANVTITREEQEAYATITGLTSNTQYVLWVKAYRDVEGGTTVTKVSEASDPIIVVTLPEYTTPDAKPPVPAISTIDGEYMDKITVQFNSLADIEYTIVWGTIDNVASKSGTATYKPTSSMSPDSVIIDELEPETTYYFWVKANNGTAESEWSDSAIGRTIPIPPPDTPEGFGVKRVLEDDVLVPDIGEHHISVQWDIVAGVNYVIDVSKSEEFTNSEQIEAGSVSEYKIATFGETELQANTRYWIRLFAKDAETKKISEYSPYLTAKTKYNNDEYNSSQETETPLEGKVTTEIISGTAGKWSVDITPANAQRLIEKLRHQSTPDYTFDLSQTSVSGINTREITIPYLAVDTISKTNQNLIIKTNKAEFIFLPGWADSVNSQNGQDINIKINVQNITAPKNIEGGEYKYLSDISSISVITEGNEPTQMIKFDKPIKIKLNYTNTSIGEVVDSYYMYPGSTWTKITNTKESINGFSYLTLYNDKAGRYAVKKQLLDSELDNYKYGNEINELLSTGLIKSVDKASINPTSLITLGDAVKILLDAAGSDYEEDYMDIASKSGLLSLISNLSTSKTITKQEAITLVMRAHEIKTGEWLNDVSIPNTYYDANDVGDAYGKYVGNAIEMDVYNIDGRYLRPKSAISRGEVLMMIKNLLEIWGKI